MKHTTPRTLRIVGYVLVLGIFSTFSAPNTRRHSETSFILEVSEVSASTLEERSPSASAPVQNTRETQDYHEIEGLFSTETFEKTESKIAAFLRRYPNGQLEPSVENLYGLLLLRTKKPADAIQHFKRAIELSSSQPSFRQYILYNLATAEFAANRIENAQESLSLVQLDLLDTGNKLKVYHLKGSIYEKKFLPLEAARQLLTAGRLLSKTGSPALPSEYRRTLNQHLNQTLTSILEISPLQQLYHEFEDSSVVDAVLFQLGAKEVSSGNAGNGEVHLRSLLTQFPQSPYLTQAAELLANVQKNAPVESHTIGVLLPMKGKFGKFGQKVFKEFSSLLEFSTLRKKIPKFA